jgi:hypothetical protein
LTVTPKPVKLPAAGVAAVIVPVLLMLNPAGQPESEYEYGAVPPLAVMACENAVPAVSGVKAVPVLGAVIERTVATVVVLVDEKLSAGTTSVPRKEASAPVKLVVYTWPPGALLARVNVIVPIAVVPDSGPTPEYSKETKVVLFVGSPPVSVSV